MGARYPPYSDKKTKLLAPPPKASFDREGNDIGAFGSVAQLLGFGAAAAATAYVMIPKETQAKYLAKVWH